MMGLKNIPQERDLLGAYERMQSSKSPVSAEELALWSQWCRFDPRLAEQLVFHISTFWREISPVTLHERVVSQPWPAVFGVLLDQVEIFSGISPQEAKLYRGWANLVMDGVSPAAGELFIIGLRAFAGKLMREDAVLAIAPYRDWGYFGRDVLMNKEGSCSKRGSVTLIPSEVRRSILDALVKSQARITVQIYRTALDGWVSCRQAERDLNMHPKLKALGNTRSRLYTKR